MSFIDMRGLCLAVDEFHKSLKLYEGKNEVDEVDLSCNKLTSLPRALLRYENITVLRINDNKLENLPSWLGKMRKLKWLYCGNNMLDAVPSSLANLSLTRWLARGNQNLPPWLGDDLNTHLMVSKALTSAKDYYLPLEEACRKAIYTFLSFRSTDTFVRHCIDKNVAKLIGRLVWDVRGSKIWVRCLQEEDRPLYEYKSAF